jgi:hypothetical protein
VRRVPSPGILKRDAGRADVDNGAAGIEDEAQVGT